MQKFLRRTEVEEKTGFSCSTIYEKMGRGEFPKPVKIGPKSVRWIEAEIAEWQQERIEAREVA